MDVLIVGPNIVDSELKNQGREGKERGQAKGWKGRGWCASAESKASSARGFVFAGGGCSDSHMPYDHNSRKGENHWLDLYQAGLNQENQNSSDSPIGHPTTVLRLMMVLLTNHRPATRSPSVGQGQPLSTTGTFRPIVCAGGDGAIVRHRDDHAPTVTAPVVREVQPWWE
jgi:hypothetical protein